MKLVSTQFEAPELNQLTTELIKIGNDITKLINDAKKLSKNAFVRRWEAGKLLYDNYAKIQEECGTVRRYCEIAGFSESVLSNNKRNYEALLTEHNITTAEDALKLCEARGIEPNSRNFEKIGTLLLTSNQAPEPPKNGPKQKSVEKRLESIASELEDIRQSHVPEGKVGNIEVAVTKEEITSLLEYVSDMKRQHGQLLPGRIPFRSETFTEFVRNYKYDMITMMPISGLADPHHANEYEALQGQKINDLCQIPVSRTTHIQIEEGSMFMDQEEIAMAQRDVLMNYVMHLHTKLGIK